MEKGLKKAIEVVDALQFKYREKYQEALRNGDKKEIAHWQAYLSALTMAAGEIGKELKK